MTRWEIYLVMKICIFLKLINIRVHNNSLMKESVEDLKEEEIID